ncbi:MAG: DUF3857 domain-containing protein [Deltaproteobacteria bacterium]|nr:DUF3857 domain-containing protein [Deltaproteobacteria bacterium]
MDTAHLREVLLSLTPISNAPVSRALLAALLVAATAAPALADNPFDAQQRSLGREAARARGAEGILPILEMWAHWDDADPAVTVAELEKLARNRRLPVARRAYAQALLARARLYLGDVDAAHEGIAELGYISDWQVAGPFDNEGKQGLDRAMGPETDLTTFEAGSVWRGKERDVGWRRYPEGLTHYGFVSFDAVHRPYANVCSYAATTITSERAQPIAVWTGAGGAQKVWWNGTLVHTDEAYRYPGFDRHAVTVGAHQGANRLVVKNCVTDTSWGFYLRVTDPRGAALRNVTISAETMPAAAGDGHGVSRLPSAPTVHLAPLEAAVSGDSPSAEAQFRLARFLDYTGGDDPAERRARQLATAAADAEPKPEYLILAALLSDQRSQMNRFLQKALEVAPRDVDVRLFHARMEQTGLHPEDALPILAELENANTPQGWEAKMLHAGLLRDLGLPGASRRIVEELGTQATEAPGWSNARAEAASAVGDRDAEIRHRTEALKGQWDDSGNRRVIIADAVRRRDRPTAVEHLEALRQISPFSQRNLSYVASLYEALGENDQAAATYAFALQVAPEAAELMVEHGQFLLRQQQPDAARDTLRAALQLRPQDAETRELLEQIEPADRADERYAADTETLLTRRTEGSGFPTTTLQDLTVNTVYENGLGSSFRQIAVQLHDDEGARQFRTYAIQFDPTSQRLDIRLARIHRADGSVLEATEAFEQQLGEPWYRIYYDTRARVIVFPDLEPGDTVELRWRLDDVAHRNLFADYYGDLSFLQSFSPIRHEEYVLITPKSREFFFNEPGLQSLRHERTEEGDTRIDRFVANDVPAIRSEPGMPGMTEVSPYLHVSTYRTWEDVGRWYWGLIQDQLRLDEELKNKVAELTRGKTELRDKVVAIHDWVVENTRYVALEFGIHGYKPYRVTQIAERGFGDCKDKASLLFAMFREAGIDAHIILTRTRRNGNITDLPASLAIFDHAIAYVPALDLYIDGTAEHSGIAELPAMDQGVTVLHVWPEGSELRRTPVLAPEHNRRERTLNVRLAQDGSGNVRAQEVVIGAMAPSYRSTYQAEGTREDRLERSLRGNFPGLQLESQSFENLDTLEQPVRYRYAAEVPQLAQRDGESLRMAPSVLEDLTRAMARAPRRRHPLDLGGTSSYLEERTVQLPNGMRAGDVPTGGTAESPFGKLVMTVEQSGRQVQTRTEFEIRRDRVTAEEYPAFRRWVQEADQILRQRLTVER